jgi:hypothetical protein
LAELVAVNLITLLPNPGAGRVAGVKVAVTPLGSPVTEKAMAALNPPLTATFTLTLLLDPAVSERELADGVA